MTPSNSLETRVTCPIDGCNTTASRQPDIDRHVDEYHGSLKYCPIYGCSYRGAKRLSRLQNHIAKMHSLTWDISKDWDFSDLSFVPSPRSETEMQDPLPREPANAPQIESGISSQPTVPQDETPPQVFSTPNNRQSYHLMSSQSGWDQGKHQNTEHPQHHFQPKTFIYSPMIPPCWLRASAVDYDTGYVPQAYSSRDVVIRGQENSWR